MLSGFGARITLPGDAFVALFSETPGRALVSLPGSKLATLAQLCGDLHYTRIGVVTDDGKITVTNQFSIDVAALRHEWAATIPMALSTSPKSRV
jgi:phosphoribosylformylglycinamidine synthase